MLTRPASFSAMFLATLLIGLLSTPTPSANARPLTNPTWNLVVGTRHVSSTCNCGSPGNCAELHQSGWRYFDSTYFGTPASGGVRSSLIVTYGNVADPENDTIVEGAGIIENNMLHQGTHVTIVNNGITSQSMCEDTWYNYRDLTWTAEQSFTSNGREYELGTEQGDVEYSVVMAARNGTDTTAYKETSFGTCHNALSCTCIDCNKYVSSSGENNNAIFILQTSQ